MVTSLDLGDVWRRRFPEDPVRTGDPINPMTGEPLVSCSSCSRFFVALFRIKSGFCEGGRVLWLWCGFAMGQGIQKCCEQRDDIPKEVVTHKFDENEKDNVDEEHPTQPVKAGKLGLFEFKKESPGSIVEGHMGAMQSQYVTMI